MAMTKTGNRIPISDAKKIGTKCGYTQVIITAFDKETGTTSVCTWGKSQSDCEQAATGGNFVKKALGWPESATNAKPARQIRNEKLTEIVKGIVSVIESPNPDDRINFLKLIGWATAGQKLLKQKEG